MGAQTTTVVASIFLAGNAAPIGTLTGVLSVAASEGIADFAAVAAVGGLKVYQAANNYTLLFEAMGLPNVLPAASGSFSVLNGPPASLKAIRVPNRTMSSLVLPVQPILQVDMA